MGKEENDVLTKQNIELRNELENLKNQIKCLTKPGFKWVSSMSCRGIPSDAVVCGRMVNDEIFCAGRAHHQGDILPARISCNSNSTEQRYKAYISFNSKEYIKYDFEILCGNNFKWVKAKKGEVPVNSFVAGDTVGGEKLYIGRTYYDGTKDANIFIIGKLQPSKGHLLFLENGKERFIEHYEILTELPNDVC